MILLQLSLVLAGASAVAARTPTPLVAYSSAESPDGQWWPIATADYSKTCVCDCAYGDCREVGQNCSTTYGMKKLDLQPGEFTWSEMGPTDRFAYKIRAGLDGGGDAEGLRACLEVVYVSAAECRAWTGGKRALAAGDGGIEAAGAEAVDFTADYHDRGDYGNRGPCHKPFDDFDGLSHCVWECKTGGKKECLNGAGDKGRRLPASWTAGGCVIIVNRNIGDVVSLKVEAHMVAVPLKVKEKKKSTVKVDWEVRRRVVVAAPPRSPIVPAPHHHRGRSRGAVHGRRPGRSLRRARLHAVPVPVPGRCRAAAAVQRRRGRRGADAAAQERWPAACVRRTGAGAGPRPAPPPVQATCDLNRASSATSYVCAPPGPGVV